MVPRSDYEIIVVDDGSSDNTHEIIEKYDAEVFSQPNGGLGAAQNPGGSHAEGEIVLLADADCVPALDWVAEIVRPFQQPDVVADLRRLWHALFREHHQVRQVVLAVSKLFPVFKQVPESNRVGGDQGRRRHNRKLHRLAAFHARWIR